MEGRYHQGQVIRFKDGIYKCIAEGKDIVVFAPSNLSGTRVKYSKMFVLHPDPAMNGKAAHAL